ncbi:uncharacterized protein LOC118741607 isoform X2 [Rhagoletis pomonella]|nr:uncharacterized protein LOC118741607 isoform X2 [Rhagoletis pomonella]
MFRCRRLAVCLRLAVVAVYVKFLLTMDEDTGKLIDLVEARRALYDARDMDHANRKRIENLWIEVSIEMNWEVSECKRKWASLRNAYTRCLREERTKSSGSAGKKKK